MEELKVQEEQKNDEFDPKEYILNAEFKLSVINNVVTKLEREDKKNTTLADAEIIITSLMHNLLRSVYIGNKDVKSPDEIKTICHDVVNTLGKMYNEFIDKTLLTINEPQVKE